MLLIRRNTVNLATDKAKEGSAGDLTTARHAPPRSNAGTDLSSTPVFEQTKKEGVTLMVRHHQLSWDGAALFPDLYLGAE